MRRTPLDRAAFPSLLFPHSLSLSNPQPPRKTEAPWFRRTKTPRSLQSETPRFRQSETPRFRKTETPRFR